MELEFVNWLRGRLPRSDRLRVGPGDDAAVLDWPGGPPLILSVDMLTAGVDFDLGEIDPRRVGRKALAVNLSDLAAMAARPRAALVSLALPRSDALRIAKELFEGLIPLAERYDISLAGGDTNTWDGPLVIDVTVVGEPTARGPLLRSGARPGDAILVTGQFGGSIRGHQFDFEPRVREALWLRENSELHGGMDVSDGLSLDLARMAKESGCGAVINLEQIPIRPAAHELARTTPGVSAVEHALSDGEDFELILAVARETAERLVASQPVECGLSVIGEFTDIPGLWQRLPNGERQPLEPRGYVHRGTP